jgi:hypothetical protein
MHTLRDEEDGGTASRPRRRRLWFPHNLGIPAFFFLIMLQSTGGGACSVCALEPYNDQEVRVARALSSKSSVGSFSAIKQLH